tara:strand:+ start:2750 stop:2941 length:192 start_codon:yes stop_codon:yes gene_type:complete
MNRFSTALTKLDTLPSDPESRFWYRSAIMDIKCALLSDLPGKDFDTLIELHEALGERYEQAKE